MLLALANHTNQLLHNCSLVLYSSPFLFIYVARLDDAASPAYNDTPSNAQERAPAVSSVSQASGEGGSSQYGYPPQNQPVYFYQGQPAYPLQQQPTAITTQNVTFLVISDIFNTTMISFENEHIVDVLQGINLFYP